MKKLSLTLALVAAFAVSTAFAAVPSEVHTDVRGGLAAVYDSYTQVRSNIRGGFLATVANDALNILVGQGVQRLRDVGEIQLADQFQNEWTQQYTSYLQGGLLGSLELGDFDPLSPWLDNFYDTLYKKTNGLVKGIRVVHDIYKLNFALAVVLKPNGTWRKHTDYDRVEYRKHFIPFANIATYWVTLEACKYYLAGSGVDNYCDDGAGELEHIMGRYVAPHISDEVFSAITGTPVPVMVQSTYSKNEFIDQFMANVAGSCSAERE